MIHKADCLRVLAALTDEWQTVREISDKAYGAHGRA
jgi:hypothetical protein